MESSEITPSDWPVDAANYELLSRVGQGAFATVYRARVLRPPPHLSDSGTQSDVAIKILDLEGADANLAEIQREVQTMRLSAHANVLPCHASFAHGSQLWLVTRLMEKGSCLHCMADMRRRMGFRGMREDHLSYILFETLRGLKYFHDGGQIHRDVKAGNILLDSAGNVRIADFGVSGWLVRAGDVRHSTKTFVGTPCWMAPEVMEQVDGYDYKADIWSLGITALELAKSFPPYAHFAPMKVLLLTIQEDPPNLETYDAFDNDATPDAQSGMWSKTFKDFFRVCLQKDPARRPACSQLLGHRLIRDLADRKAWELRREMIVAELVGNVDDVGRSTRSAARLPGTVPVTISDRPAGTTWVFSDGSQVLSASSSVKGNETGNNADFFDEFEKKTGGENFRSEKKTGGGFSMNHAVPGDNNATHRRDNRQGSRVVSADASTPKKVTPQVAAAPSNADIMDEFEKVTGGENYDREKKMRASRP